MEAGELSLLGVALVGSLAYGGGDFIGGRASLRLSPVGVIVLAQFAALAVAAKAVPWPGWSSLTGPANVLLIPGVLGGLFYAVALAALYHGIARGRAALVTPVFGIVSVLVPLVADAVLGRGLTQPQVGGLLVCAVAVILLAQVPEHTPGHGPHFSFCLGVGGGLADGAADVCLGILPTAQAFDALLLARAVMAAVALALFLALLARRHRPRTGTRPVAFAIAALFAIAAGICDAFGHLAYVALATAGSIAVASALVGVLSAAVVILLAVALLRERLSAPQLAGMATGALGVLSLSA